MFDLISTFLLDLPTSTDALFWPLPLHQLAGLGCGLWTVDREESHKSGQLVEQHNVPSASEFRMFNLISGLFFSLSLVFFLIKVKFITNSLRRSSTVSVMTNSTCPPLPTNLPTYQLAFNNLLST